MNFAMLFTKAAGILLVCALSLPSGVNSAYSEDIVQYWNEKLGLAVNNSIALTLSSAQVGWTVAFVHTAILLAANNSHQFNRDVQQTAVSFAAHDSLVSVFSTLWITFDENIVSAEDAIGAGDTDKKIGRDIGEQAARAVIIARAGDGHTKFVRYTYKPAGPGVYQATPPFFAFEPLTPDAGFIRPYAGIYTVDAWTPPYFTPTTPGYHTFLIQSKEKGVRSGSTRNATETETAYLFLESQATWFNRFASLIITDTLKNDILKSAKFYAILNYGFANAGFLSYKTKYLYNTWRPVTALQYNGTYLASGNRIYDPTWTPLVNTPTHQDYISTHAAFSSAAGGILKRYLNITTLNPPVTISSNVTTDSVGILTRTYYSIDDAVRDCGLSRVFAGIHFQFSVDEGRNAGDAIAANIFNSFETGWGKL